MTRKHYHVNTFRPGCLNDSSEGPYTNKRDAMKACTALVRSLRDCGMVVNRTEPGRYEAFWDDSYGGFIVKVEDCDQPITDCEDYTG